MLRSQPNVKPVCARKVPTTRKSIRRNTDDTDSEDDANVEAAIDPINMGMDEWTTYLNTVEDIPDGMGIIRWWGVCQCCYSLCTHR